MTDFLQNTGWFLDLLDVGLVAFVIYRVILLLKGTLSSRYLFAFAFILVISILSRFAGLRTINWLSDNFLGSLIIILVVVFQHDIRRALVTTRRNRVSTEPVQEEAFEAI